MFAGSEGSGGQRPKTAGAGQLPFRNSRAAKLDALHWTNQRNLRILLEHITAELLQAEPEDPLMFIWEFLDSYGEEKQTEEVEEAAAQPTPQQRPGSSGGEAVDKMRGDCEHWKKACEEKELQVSALKRQIKELEEAIEKLDLEQQ